MFDPTAFENMKVVIEGELYDRDLSGEIRILDRNDLFNSAKLSRTYNLIFTDCSTYNLDVSCTLIMEAELANLAAELLPIAHSDKLAGCKVTVKYTVNHQEQREIFQKIQSALEGIWGSGRTIDQVISRNPFSDQNLVTNEIKITFNRLVYEDQVDDITAMIDYMLVGIKKLREII